VQKIRDELAADTEAHPENKDANEAKSKELQENLDAINKAIDDGKLTSDQICELPEYKELKEKKNDVPVIEEKNEDGSPSLRGFQETLTMLMDKLNIAVKVMNGDIKA